MSFVGIVYGKDDEPLYCEDLGDEYHVLNGQWHFTKDTTFIFGNRNLKWRIVIENMDEFGLDYNAACDAICEALK